MNWLPVVERELRVAARKRSTFWVRVLAAGSWVLLGGGFLVVSAFSGAGAANLGASLFQALIWTSLGFALAAGLFWTADCLSEEKREGTMGLLFLTELRGTDVVAGKLLSTSVRGCYGMLAVVPILALTLILGGVTPGQLGRSALALGNALFYSLALGMCVSAISRDSQKALMGTLALLLAGVLGGPVADSMIAGLTNRPFRPLWSLSSPGYGLVTAGSWGGANFASAFLLTHAIGWMLLGVASYLLPHSWQEKRRGVADRVGRWSYVWKYGTRRRRERRRRAVLDIDPVEWVGSREIWMARWLWLTAIVLGLSFLAVWLWSSQQEVWMAWTYAGGLVSMLLYLWAASQASRLLLEARRSGWLELLLVTPVTERSVIRGQWRALGRLFGIPLLLLLCVLGGGVVLGQWQMMRLMNQAATTAATAGAATTNAISGATTGSTVTVQTYTVASGGTKVSVSGAATGGGAGQWTPGMREVLVVCASGILTFLAMVGNLVALFWFGMWMGMTSRTGNQATMKTLLFVQVIPWFLIAFGSSILAGLVLFPLMIKSGANQPGAWLMWYPVVNAGLSAGLALAKDVGFILWSRNRLYRRMRLEAARVAGGERTPPAVAPMVRPPPIVAGRVG